MDRRNESSADQHADESESAPHVASVLPNDLDQQDSVGGRRYDRNSLEPSNDRMKEDEDEVKEIKVVERMVAELLEENARLRNTVKHQKV